MTAGILFVENYVAGGSDQVARLLLERLPFSSLTVMVNQNNDMAILRPGALPSHVRIERYCLLTIPEMLAFSRSKAAGPLRTCLWLMAHTLRYPLFVFSIFYFLIKIARLKATVFVANNGGYPGGDYCRSATIAASLLPAMGVFHIVHSMAAPPKKQTVLLEWVIDRIIDRRSRLITVCRAAAQQLKVKRWIRQNVEVIYNGLEPASGGSYPANPAEFNILNVGYFDQNKNQEMLIRALHLLVQNGHSNIRVNFLGAETDAGLKERCRQTARELGVAESVDFHGFVSDPQPWFNACDLFVLCSNCEGLPMTIIEAMRAGKPVVSTAVGGVTELVEENRNGFVVQPGDYVNLAASIERLLLDRSLAADFGSVSKAMFEDGYTIDKMVAEYVRVLALITGPTN